METLKFTRDEFAVWFDTISSDIVKQHHFDKYYDIRTIVNKQVDVDLGRGGENQATLYWSAKETGASLIEDLDIFKFNVEISGAVVKYMLEFNFDRSSDWFCMATKLP